MEKESGVVPVFTDGETDLVKGKTACKRKERKRNGRAIPRIPQGRDQKGLKVSP